MEPRIRGAITWSLDPNRTENGREEVWGMLTFGKKNQITEKIQGNNNRISSQQRSEITLLLVENLGNTVEDLDGRMKFHATVKYSLLLIIFIFIISYAANKCYKRPKRIKQRIEKDSQEDRIMDHENALIEMGYLRPKTKKKEKKSKKGQKVKPTVVKKSKIKVKDEYDEISEKEAKEVA